MIHIRNNIFHSYCENGNYDIDKSDVARKSYPSNGTSGSIRCTKNGKYIIIGPDGKILLFGLAR